MLDINGLKKCIRQDIQYSGLLFESIDNFQKQVEVIGIENILKTTYKYLPDEYTITYKKLSFTIGKNQFGINVKLIIADNKNQCYNINYDVY